MRSERYKTFYNDIILVDRGDRVGKWLVLFFLSLIENDNQQEKEIMLKYESLFIKNREGYYF
ncbi:hypothetical protein BKK45_12185 [Bacillus cereus]|nr:hypothetical protein BKK45_12185 [Bacillus cereus]